MLSVATVCTNAAHGATQGLIPELVPESLRGLLGIKAIFEVPLAVILVSFTVASFIKGGNLWLGLFTLMAFMAVSTVLTMLRARGTPAGDTAAAELGTVRAFAGVDGRLHPVILGLGMLHPMDCAAIAGIQSVLSLSLVMGVAGLLAIAWQWHCASGSACASA